MKGLIAVIIASLFSSRCIQQANAVNDDYQIYSALLNGDRKLGDGKPTDFIVISKTASGVPQICENYTEGSVKMNY